MSFQFAIYYFYDKTVQIESTSVILGTDQFSQVQSKPDLEDDNDWIEIKCPTRKDPAKTVAAKVLLFGGELDFTYYFQYYFKQLDNCLWCRFTVANVNVPTLLSYQIRTRTLCRRKTISFSEETYGLRRRAGVCKKRKCVIPTM